MQLCRQVKASPVLGHIPVILLTAASSADSRLEGVAGGADDYMTKPFDSQLLQARVETILKNRNLVQQFFFDSITLQQSSVKVPAAYRSFCNRPSRRWRPTSIRRTSPSRSSVNRWA
ncbi:response regulator [Chitinophaga sedimenti]|uniref:response regulator transcription factor n=1 Tax=Chitinophaga sedimenti TaxID=2033606 RepID=UPI002005A815|nr:response regulator [Chitinophaga sedimenti]MCK7555714.1 response regulator [Chitinophaga sedimenti]